MESFELFDIPDNLPISNTLYPKLGNSKANKTLTSLSFGPIWLIMRGRSKNTLECSLTGSWYYLEKRMQGV